jgi:hypothetical protein
MAKAKQGFKRKRSKTALPVWAAAGVSLAMMGGASANAPATDMPSKDLRTAKAGNETGLSARPFGVFWALREDAALESASIAPLDLARETEKLLTRFPNARALLLGQVDAQAPQAGGRRFRARIVDADGAREGGHLGHRLKAFEPQRKAIAIGPVVVAVWQMDRSAVKSLQGVEHRPIILPEQPLRHMQPAIRVDADQMSVEGGVMDFR